MDRFVLRRRLLAGILVIASAGFSACSSPPVEVTPIGDIGPATTTPSADGTVVAGRAVTPTQSTGQFGATSETPTSIGNIAVSPREVTMGNVVLTFSVQNAQPMLDPARAAPPPANDQQKESAQPKGYTVLGGSSLRVTNNFDPSQSAPADSPTQIIRHVALQVKDKTSGQLIPHVNVTMDLLRDGRPVLQDQPLAPMVPAGGGVGQMEYGNNVKIPGKGEYQVFIHTEPSPLLGTGSLGVAQFNVSVQ